MKSIFTFKIFHLFLIVMAPVRFGAAGKGDDSFVSLSVYEVLQVASPNFL